MPVKIIHPDLDLPPEREKVIQQKFSQPLSRLLKGMIGLSQEVKTLKLRMDKSKEIFVLKADLLLPKNEHIYAKETNRNFLDGITNLREAVEKQVKKYREKIGIDHPQNQPIK